MILGFVALAALLWCLFWYGFLVGLRSGNQIEIRQLETQVALFANVLRQCDEECDTPRIKKVKDLKQATELLLEIKRNEAERLGSFPNFLSSTVTDADALLQLQRPTKFD